MQHISKTAPADPWDEMGSRNADATEDTAPTFRELWPRLAPLLRRSYIVVYEDHSERRRLRDLLTAMNEQDLDIKYENQPRESAYGCDSTFYDPKTGQVRPRKRMPDDAPVGSEMRERWLVNRARYEEAKREYLSRQHAVSAATQAWLTLAKWQHIQYWISDVSGRTRWYYGDCRDDYIPHVAGRTALDNAHATLYLLHDIALARTSEEQRQEGQFGDGI